MHTIPITIAEILIELTSPLSAAELGIEERLGPFIGTTENPRARLALCWEESHTPPVPPGELIYDPGSIWKMYRNEEDYYASLTYQDEGRAAQTQSLLRANPAWNDLTLTEQRTLRPGSASPSRSGQAWQSLLNIGAGELILRTSILFTGGLIFHSAGLDDNGQGVVFVGHAGVGKSTQLGMWNQEPGVIAMNDDRVAVRVTESGPMCYGTPWGGTADIARNHAAPLAALIVLEQAPKNEITPLSPAEAAPLLAPRAFLPYWDAAPMRRAMSNLNTILANVPVYRLRNRPEKTTIPLVRSVL